MRSTRCLFGRAAALGLVLALGLALPGHAEAPNVVVTIKPIHALVSGVMTGVATPELLVKGNASPHTYALKPSETRLLNSAGVVFRVSEAVEPFTAKIVAALPASVHVVTLRDTPGLVLLARRSSFKFEHHAHGPHEHNAVPANEVDGHLWLDPANARKLAEQIERELSKRYPAHAAQFRDNRAALDRRLEMLDAELAQALAPIAAQPYIVFHDAFQYLEARYRLNAVGSILVSPDVPVSGKRLASLRAKIAAAQATCVFAEPQAEPRLLQNLTEGTSARVGELDGEGLSLEPGPELYFALMRALARNLRSCLLSDT